jgi:hypothetical protein
MSVTDKEIVYRRRRLYLPAVENAMWQLTAAVQGTGSAQDITHALGATPNVLLVGQTQGDGTATATTYGTHTAATVEVTLTDNAQYANALVATAGSEVSSFGFPGVNFLVSDAVSWCLRVPIDFDPLWPLGFRAHFSSASVTKADDFQFTVAFDVKDAPAATATATAVEVAGTALAAASTALDTVITAQTWIDATAYKNTWSPRGIKDAAWSSVTAIEDGAAMIIKLTATVADTAAFLFGLEIDYMPRLTTGYSGAERDGALVGAPPV